MYKRILVPIDGSDTSTQALVAGLQMARESGGSVHIIHVIEELAQVIAYDPYGGYPGDLADEHLGEAHGQRRADVVIKEAEGYKADLIVVGTHGRRGIGRVLLGSGAEQIIRLAPIPVLVIRAPESDQAHGASRHAQQKVGV